MRGINKLGLLAVAALALAAWVAVPTASADVLCNSKPTGFDHCNTAHYGVGTVINGHSNLIVFKSQQIGEVKCLSSDFSAKLTNEGSLQSPATYIPPAAEVTSYTFKSCNFPFEVVRLGGMKLPWAKAGGNGAIDQTGGFEFKIVYSGLTCYYNAGVEKRTMLTTGGTPAVADENVLFARVAGSTFCPSSFQTEGRYTITSPTTLYWALD